MSLQSIAPFLFVFLWSTGFIGAKFGLPYAEPLTFLLLRFLAISGLMAAFAVLTRAPWPKSRQQVFHIAVSGILVHAIYLGGVFSAIGHGLPAGITALVVGMQPLLTACGAGWLLGERVSARQWLGLALGFVGVALVIVNKLGQLPLLATLTPALVALLGITAGTLYQKRFCARFDLRTGAVIQFLPSAMLTAVVAGLTESMYVEWTSSVVFALMWLVLVLSFGAISLLNLLIHTGGAVHVARLFYLTPPMTALIAWFVFGETLSAPAIAGMVLALFGVYLARGRRA